MKKFFVLSAIIFLGLGNFVFLKGDDTLSIHQIQYTTDPSGNSPYEGQYVWTYGVVTVEPDIWYNSKTMFIQDGSGEWQGIAIYFSDGFPSGCIRRGDSILVHGEVQEYYNMTEIVISSIDDIVILKRNAKMPSPIVVNASQINSSESLEGVLCALNNGVVVDTYNYYWIIQDTTGTCYVGKQVNYSFLPIPGETLKTLIGPIYYTFGTFRLEPIGNWGIQKDVAGSGYFRFKNYIYAEGEIDTLELEVKGTCLDTLKVLKILMPFTFSNVKLEGSVFQNATFSIIADTILIENAEIKQFEEGLVKIEGVNFNNVGLYKIKIWTGKNSLISQLDSLAFPYIEVLDVEGSGMVNILPKEIFSSPFDIELEITGEIGELNQAEIIIPSIFQWSGTYSLSGEFKNANVEVHDSIIKITDFSLLPSESGTITLKELSFNRQNFPAIPIFEFKVYTGRDSLAPVEEKLFVAIPREDSTYPLICFHSGDSLIDAFLQGRPIVRVKGVVNAVFGQKVYMQDSTGGIVLYNLPEVVNLGEYIYISGKYSPYGGLAEVIDGEVYKREGFAHIDTLLINDPDSLNEKYEAMLIRLNNVKLSSRELPCDDTLLAFKWVDSLTFKPFIIYIDRNSGLGGEVLPCDTLDIIGVLKEYYGTYQVVPRNAEDLILMGEGLGFAKFEIPFGYKNETVDSLVVLINSYGAKIRKLAVLKKTDKELFNFDNAYLIIENQERQGIVSNDTIYFDSLDMLEGKIILQNVRFKDTISEDKLIILTSNSLDGDLEEMFNLPSLYIDLPLDSVQLYDENGNSVYNGKIVSVGGVVVIPNDILTSSSYTNFWIYDGRGGVNVYKSDFIGNFDEGTAIVIKNGTVSEYKGVTEIIPGEVIVFGRDYIFKDSLERFLIKKGKGESLFEDDEGKLVLFDTVCVNSSPTLAGGGYSVYIWNGSKPIELYIPENAYLKYSDFFNKVFKKGNYISIWGVVSQYDYTEPYLDNYELLIWKPENILWEGSSGFEQEKVEISISPNPFAPELGEKALIEIKGPADGIYDVFIYDLKGRRIKSLWRNKVGPGVVEWDGKTDKGTSASIGLYIVKVKVRLNNKIKDYHKLLILGAKF